MRYLFGLAVAALLSSITAAHATSSEADELFTGSGLVCDTKQQAERFVSLMDSDNDVEKTLLAVNNEAGDENACVVATIGFKPGSKVADLDKNGTVVHIIEIQVFAVATAVGLQPVEPKTYYSVFVSGERSA